MLLIPLLLSVFAQEPAEAALREWGLGIEQSINKKDPSVLDRHLDADALLSTALKDVDAKPEFVAGFKKGAKRTYSIGQPLVDILKQAGDGSFKFLRIHSVEGKKRALFRLLSGDSFNYQDLILETGADGSIKVVDVFNFVYGEKATETVRRMFLTFAASQPGVLGKLLGQENEWMKNISKITTMNAQVKEGKHAEVLKTFASMPESMRKEKALLILCCTSAAEVSEPEWFKAVDGLWKNFPGDPCLPFHSIGAFSRQKRFAEALKAVEDLDKVVGGDGFLQTQRAAIHLEAGAFDQARAAANKSIEIEKGLAGGYWFLVSISLKEKKFAETAAMLTRIEKELKLKFQDLTKVEDYAEFVKSPEYQEWLKTQPEK